MVSSSYIICVILSIYSVLTSEAALDDTTDFKFQHLADQNLF